MGEASRLQSHTDPPPPGAISLSTGQASKPITTELASEDSIRPHLVLLFEAIEDDDVELVRFKLGHKINSKYTMEKCHPLCQVYPLL